MSGWIWLVTSNVWTRCISFQSNALTGRASVETYDHRLFDGLRWRRLGEAILCERG